MSEDGPKTTRSAKAHIHFDAEGIPDFFNPPSDEELKKFEALGKKLEKEQQTRTNRINLKQDTSLLPERRRLTQKIDPYPATPPSHS